MAMLEDVFVNIGISGSHESAEGIGTVSFSGVRNFLKHDWPQMDIGEIQFYNPKVATDEVPRNRRLTRNQAWWLATKMAAYANTLDIPSEEAFGASQFGVLKPEPAPAEEDEPVLGSTLEKALQSQEGKNEAELRRALHSIEASLTELVRDHPEWARSCDHQALVLARAQLKK